MTDRTARSRTVQRVLLRTTALLVLLAAAAGCAKSPTGREQLLLFPESRMNKMGRQQFAQLKQEKPIVQDAGVNRYVRCVALAVAAQARDETGVSDWEVMVFRDDTANAFALPGGRIGVHSGLLPVAKTPGQLAAVLGHEVGHVIAHHGNERVSQALGVQLGLAAAAAAMEREQNRDLVLGALGLGAQYGVLLPFSRTHESEADRIGQRLMAEAGFDPHAAIDLWQNMEAAHGGGPPEWMSTHPAPGNRIEQLRQGLGRTVPIYEQARRQGRNPQCGPPPEV